MKASMHRRSLTLRLRTVPSGMLSRGSASPAREDGKECGFQRPKVSVGLVAWLDQSVNLIKWLKLMKLSCQLLPSVENHLEYT